MVPSVVLAAFVLILPVELPDKTLFATLVLATRFPPLPVFVGVGAAFGLQVAIAVTAGSLLSLLPGALVSAVVAVLGGRVGVKVARSAGRVVNVSVEFEDVAALARELQLPVKEVLRAATAAAHQEHPGASATLSS